MHPDWMFQRQAYVTVMELGERQMWRLSATKPTNQQTKQTHKSESCIKTTQNEKAIYRRLISAGCIRMAFKWGFLHEPDIHLFSLECPSQYTLQQMYCCWFISISLYSNRFSKSNFIYYSQIEYTFFWQWQYKKDVHVHVRRRLWLLFSSIKNTRT